jgi:hypothetical protein
MDQPATRARRGLAAIRSVPLGAWTGCAGSALLALAQWIKLAAYPQYHPEPGDPAVLRAFRSDHSFGTLTAAGVLLLIAAWIMARRHFDESDRPRLKLVLAFWVVPLLPALGVLSDDFNIYAEFGWDQLQGLNPYDTGIATSGSPFPTGGSWNGMTAAYPPLALKLFQVVVALAGSHWYFSVVGLRALALAGLALLVWGLKRVAEAVGVDPRFALWLGALNPVVIVHGVGGMHVDLLMAGLAVAAIGVALTRPDWRGLVFGSVVVGLAVGVKQHALLAVVPVAALAVGRLRPWLAVIRRTALAAVVAVATFLALGVLTGLGQGWTSELATVTRYDTPGPATLASHFTGAAFAWFDAASPRSLYSTVSTVVLVVALAAIMALFVRYGRRDPLRFLAAAALVAALGLSGTREWYLTFWIAVLPLARPGKWMRRAASLLVPFMALTAAFHSYQGWWVMESVHVAAGFAVALNAGGWIVRRSGAVESADGRPGPPVEPAAPARPRR